MNLAHFLSVSRRSPAIALSKRKKWRRVQASYLLNTHHSPQEGIFLNGKLLMDDNCCMGQKFFFQVFLSLGKCMFHIIQKSLTLTKLGLNSGGITEDGGW